jgi:hypothetical protein
MHVNFKIWFIVNASKHLQNLALIHTLNKKKEKKIGKSSKFGSNKIKEYNQDCQNQLRSTMFEGGE